MPDDTGARERAAELLAGEEAWVVGGAIRDAALGRPVLDLDIACREPVRAARGYAKAIRGAPFPLSERWGAWRVVLGDGRTVDFTLLRGSIEEDLATRDFTINAIAEPLGGGEPADPHGGLGDLERRLVRAVSDTIFDDDPLRLLRAVRLEDELGLRMEEHTEQLVRDHRRLVTAPAGERTLAELIRLSERGYRRLDELGLLDPLGGSLDGLERATTPELRLVIALGENLARYPASNELRRLASVVLRATRPTDSSPRSIHRFRRLTEPYALEALQVLGATELTDAVLAARAADPAEPLVRGDELGLPPGPEIGRILELIAEERAAGTISTREEALELARREVAS
jgi:tRNA nucleotidyltransferase/poly(A) polymerase